MTVQRESLSYKPQTISPPRDGLELGKGSKMPKQFRFEKYFDLPNGYLTKIKGQMWVHLGESPNYLSTMYLLQ